MTPIHKDKHTCLNGIPPVLDGWSCIPPAITRRARLNDRIFEQYQDFYASEADFYFDEGYVEVPDHATWRVHEYTVKNEVGTVGTVTEELTQDQLKAHYPHYTNHFEDTDHIDEEA